MLNLETDIQQFTDTFYYERGLLFKKDKLDKPVGSFDKSSGYYRLKYKNKSYLNHRIIFALVYGYLPKYVDHIDRDKLNNLAENLREATKSQNVVNSRVRCDNPYKLKGVTFHKASGKYVAQSFTKNKRVHIGLFLTPEEAGKAYDKKALELFGDFAVLNYPVVPYN